jgi:hypothetical protein
MAVIRQLDSATRPRCYKVRAQDQDGEGCVWLRHEAQADEEDPGSEMICYFYEAV